MQTFYLLLKTQDLERISNIFAYMSELMRQSVKAFFPAYACLILEWKVLRSALTGLRQMFRIHVLDSAPESPSQLKYSASSWEKRFLENHD